VHWASELPETLSGVLVGNEVLDAMPVKLLARHGGQTGGAWHERGVSLDGGALVWADRPTGLRPPVAIEGPHDVLTEIHPQAEAFIATLADRLCASVAAGGRGGAAFFIDYGFPEHEYYHPQRHMGTVMCHRAHQADDNPLADVGLKDITAHVNFTGVALAGQDNGLHVLGYTSQARFLLNCGLADALDGATPAQRADALKLVNEHEMGELFKVVGFCTGEPWAARGFAQGDRSHRL
jgi:SAM-dependent MidA family methyltransferase